MCSDVTLAESTPTPPPTNFLNSHTLLNYFSVSTKSQQTEDLRESTAYRTADLSTQTAKKHSFGCLCTATISPQRLRHLIALFKPIRFKSRQETVALVFLWYLTILKIANDDDFMSQSYLSKLTTLSLLSGAQRSSKHMPWGVALTCLLASYHRFLYTLVRAENNTV